MKQAWLLQISYKNKFGQVVSKKEYHLSYDATYNRLEAMSAKLQVLKASVSQEFHRGVINVSVH